MKCVLVIEDDPLFRRCVCDYLAELGWRVLEASDGDMGLRMAWEHRPEAVVCDLIMPGRNGFKICQELRAIDGLQPLRIIITSGRAFADDRRVALEAGADEYLVKPVDLRELAELLSRRGLVRSVPEWLPSGDAPSPSHEPEAGQTTVRFWGVRGSIASPGPGTVKYGGNTACVEVRAEGQIIILDAGTGLRLLGRSLMEEFGHKPPPLTLLLTHTHWDHIQGLPFFVPALRPEYHLRILGFEGARHGLDSLLSIQMESAFFPVGMRESGARIHVEELQEPQFQIGGVVVQAMHANHPGICMGYRLTTSSGSIAFFPDNEVHVSRERWPNNRGEALDHSRREHALMIQFLRGTDLLIMDGQYDSEEYLQRLGWGHGCVEDVVNLAIDAGIRRLLLFHHDPDHDDARIDFMVSQARAIAAGRGSGLLIDAAREGQTERLGDNP